MNTGVALRVAVGPKTFVNRTMFVGKIADDPSPATAAPTIERESATKTRSEIPVSSVIAHAEIRLLSFNRPDTMEANPRPKIRNAKYTTVRLMPFNELPKVFVYVV